MERAMEVIGARPFRILLLASLMGAPPAHGHPARVQDGGSCAPSWRPTFGGLPGTDDEINALTVFDDGSGAALYAGGMFTVAGGQVANHVAKWDGSSWSPLGSGLEWRVWTLAAFDDGSGAALYAGGAFWVPGGYYIARWDGTAWSAVGSGMDQPVDALAV